MQLSNGPNRSAAPEPPLDVNKLPTTDEIRTKLDVIRRMKREGKTLDEVRKAHLDFARQYPKLVETVMDDNLDTRQLSYMLSMFDQVRTQQVPFNRASQTVGKAMYDQYMAPNLTPQQRATVQAKLKDLENASPEVLAREAAKLGQSATTRTGSGRDGGDRK